MIKSGNLKKLTINGRQLKNCHVNGAKTLSITTFSIVILSTTIKSMAFRIETLVGCTINIV